MTPVPSNVKAARPLAAIAMLVVVMGGSLLTASAKIDTSSIPDAPEARPEFSWEVTANQGVPRGSAKAVALSDDGRYAILSSWSPNNDSYIIATDQAQPMRYIKFESDPGVFAISSDGSRFAVTLT